MKMLALLSMILLIITTIITIASLAVDYEFGEERIYVDGYIYEKDGKSLKGI